MRAFQVEGKQHPAHYSRIRLAVLQPQRGLTEVVDRLSEEPQ